MIVKLSGISLFLFLLLFVSSTAAAEKIVKDSFLSNNKKRTYYLFVPETIKGPAPLIVLLHGSGHNGLSLVEKWKDLAGKEGFIVVGPDSANPSIWSPSEDGPDFMRDLVEMLKSKYPINPRRVYLFGHSGGAVYALTLSMLESEYFAATAVHAGAWRKPNEYPLPNVAQRKIPIAIWVGTVDPYFPLTAVRATRDALQAQGFPVKVTEMPGHDHWYYDLAPDINRGAWEFLKQHELSADQRFAEFNDPEETTRANKLIQEADALRKEAYGLMTEAADKEDSLERKDFLKEREEIKRAAQEAEDTLKRSAGLWRSAAEKAEAAGRFRLSDKNRQYLSLVVQHSLKSAEMADVLRDEAEAWLGDSTVETVHTKLNEARAKANKLRQEADDLREQMKAQTPGGSDRVQPQ